MEKFLEENANAEGGTQPILTRETMAYDISLSISCVCLHANDDILKGRASAAYELAMLDLENMTNATWHSLLQHVLVQYVTLLTNPEGPAPSVPTLTRPEIIQRDTAGNKARATAAAAAAANADSCGDGSGDADADGKDAALVQNGEGEAAQPAAAKAAGGAQKSKAASAAAAPAQKRRGRG